MATLKDKLTARNGQHIDTAFARIFNRDTLTVKQEHDHTSELIAQARLLRSEMVGRGFARAFRPLGTLLRNLRDARRARGAAKVLSRLDDRTLSDIGIFRADIEAVTHRMAETGNDNTTSIGRTAA